MQSQAPTVTAYLAELPPDRRAALEAVREVIHAHLDAGFEEVMQYGMITYVVPHRLYPAGYHVDPKLPLPYLGLASQKQHLSLYLMSVYCGCVGEQTEADQHTDWFRAEYEKTGKKLDMGKCCLRFKRVEDLPLPLIGEAVRRVPVAKYVAFYEQGLSEAQRAKAARAAAKTKAAPPASKAKAPASKAKAPAPKAKAPASKAKAPAPKAKA